MKKYIYLLVISFSSVPSFADDCNATAPVFTHCANQYGSGTPNNCSFTGLREVRYGNGTEWSYKKDFGGFGGYLCRADQFPPATFSGGPYRCEYSDFILTAAIDTPDNCSDRHDCNGFFENIPGGEAPHIEPRIIEGGPEIPAGNDIGAFRTKCAVSHFAYDDPLVYPNQSGSSHLHMFAGNTSVSAMSDPHNLAKTGGSTCDGGILNRSAYWTPALLDMATKKPVLPKDSIWYYKEGYNGLAGSDFVLPEGLGMIGRKFYWTCDVGRSRYQHIPSCDASDRLDLVVDFPQCWDGQNKWLSDESHTAYPSNRSCPETHPHVLPQITLNLRYSVEYAGQTDSLMLSSDMSGVSRGSTAHADWINGWAPEISTRWIENCLERGADCHANLLGDGGRLR